MFSLHLRMANPKNRARDPTGKKWIYKKDAAALTADANWD